MTKKMAAGLMVGMVLAAGGGWMAAKAKSPVKPESGAWTLAAEFPENDMSLRVSAPPLEAGREAQFAVRLTDARSGSPVKDAEVRLVIEPQAGGPRMEYGLCLTPESAQWQDTDEAAYVVCAVVDEPGLYQISVTASVGRLSPMTVSSLRAVTKKR